MMLVRQLTLTKKNNYLWTRFITDVFLAQSYSIITNKKDKKKTTTQFFQYYIGVAFNVHLCIAYDVLALFSTKRVLIIDYLQFI